MKKLVLASLILLIGFVSIAQDSSPYKFKTVKDNSSTTVKDQCQTGTCWSFATTSFIESELLRMGKGEHNISEMFNVRVTYPKKAEKFVRYGGKYQFGPGSLSHDVINAIRDYGMVPDEVYSGLKDGNEIHHHGEMDKILGAMVTALVKNNNNALTEDWDDAVESVLDVYLGEYPSQFDYKGKSYTPESFRDAMGVKADDYINLTSFSHHPFYKEFILEVPDNFSQGTFYNVKIDELYQVASSALENGYTVSWDADVSEKGFSFKNGIAIAPVKDTKKEDVFTKVVAELKVNQNIRQKGFNDMSTTDDHLMHLTGLAKDQNGTTYFMMKNSWGQANPFEGRQYVSESYFKLKTISILVHKDALSKDLKSKLGIK